MTACLIGTRTRAGYGDTVTRVATGGHPDQMLPTLRRIWRWACDGDTSLFADHLLRHDWADLDAHPRPGTSAHGRIIDDGIGVWEPDPTHSSRDTGTAHRRRRHAHPMATGTAWLYVIDLLDDHILVFEATTRGTWAVHSRHRLHTNLDGRASSPMPFTGDAATADHLGHHWQAATVTLDGLPAAWPGDICVAEHARGVTVTRFDRDTLAGLLTDLEQFYGDRLPGSGLPRHHLDGDVLVTTWYTGTPHAQTATTHADQHGRFILGPHLWPWIVTGGPPPTDDGRALRNGTTPFLDWVSPAGFFACHPQLAGHTLPRVCAAVTALAGDRGVAVIKPGDNARHVWLVAPGHALMLTAVAWDATTHTVVLLPRPLGGSWTTDEPVPVLSTEQVAAACAQHADERRPNWENTTAPG